MSIQSIASALAPQDAGAAKATNRPMQSDDGGLGAAFAGLLAGILFAPAAPAHTASMSQADGTSELDQAVEDPTADATGSVGESKDTSDAADPNNPALPASSVSLSSTNEIVRSVAALDPALQAKLARVIARVEQETGHTVSVQETYRTQTRQDALYAQGRDTAGPVVTWTHNSKHTQGRAVDVLLDGGNASPDAYRVLQRIAQEEGLHTLGARDPGHLELPTNGRAIAANATGAQSFNIPAEPADAASPGRVVMPQAPQAPQLAQVAQVARVAQVAQVAQVAKPGATTRAQGANIPAPTTSANDSGASSQNLNGIARVTMANAGKNSGGNRDSSSDRGGQTPNDSRNGYAAFGANLPARGHTGPLVDVQPAGAPVSSSAARVEHVMDVVENTPARHLSQITMSVDTGNGTSDRIHVAMRGSSLSSTIDAADRQAAQAMSARSEELVRALNRDGVQVDSLRVRAAAERPAATIAATTGAQTTNTSADAQSRSRFDRGDAWQQQQDQQERRDAQQERQDRRQQRELRQQRRGSAS